MYFALLAGLFLASYLFREYCFILLLNGIFDRDIYYNGRLTRIYIYPGERKDAVYLALDLKGHSVFLPSKHSLDVSQLSEINRINKFPVFIPCLLNHLVSIFYCLNFFLLNLFLSKDITRSVLYFIRWTQGFTSTIIMNKFCKINDSNLVLI